MLGIRVEAFGDETTRRRCGWNEVAQSPAGHDCGAPAFLDFVFNRVPPTARSKPSTSAENRCSIRRAASSVTAVSAWEWPGKSRSRTKEPDATHPQPEAGSSSRARRRILHACPKTWSFLPLGEVLYSPAGNEMRTFRRLRSCRCTTSPVRRLSRNRGRWQRRVIGISLFMGGINAELRRHFTAGHAYRLPRHLLRASSIGPADAASLCATQGSHHADDPDRSLQPTFPHERQLCRWLLATLDRIPLRPAGDDTGIGCEHARCAS